MKRAMLLTVLLLIGLCSSVFGEAATDIYVRTIRIEKVFIHSLGYAIVYSKPSGMDYGLCYIPFNWFTEAGGAGEIIWGRNRAYPYMSIFWVNGKFSHIKLYFQESLGHQMWEQLRKSYDEVKDVFNVTPETFELEF
jgi:hypothetical protein